MNNLDTSHIFKIISHYLNFSFQKFEFIYYYYYYRTEWGKSWNYTGLNTGQCWVTYGQAQRLGYCPEGWFKHLTQLLVENNPIAGFVHILPSTGLYLTQHFYSVARLAVLPLPNDIPLKIDGFGK